MRVMKRNQPIEEFVISAEWLQLRLLSSSRAVNLLQLIIYSINLSIANLTILLVFDGSINFVITQYLKSWLEYHIPPG